MKLLIIFNCFTGRKHKVSTIEYIKKELSLYYSSIDFFSSSYKGNITKKILEDGTLSVSIPEGFGMGHGTRQIVMDNEMEQHFEENRRRFLESIYNQPRLPADGA
jgi:hypothetical protein